MISFGEWDGWVVLVKVGLSLCMCLCLCLCCLGVLLLVCEF